MKNRHVPLSAGTIGALLSYNATTGELHWLPRTLSAFNGDYRVFRSWNAKKSRKARPKDG